METAAGPAVAHGSNDASSPSRYRYRTPGLGMPGAHSPSWKDWPRISPLLNPAPTVGAMARGTVVVRVVTTAKTPPLFFLIDTSLPFVLVPREVPYISLNTVAILEGILA